MVSIATALGRTGFQDWLIQRISAIILAAYSVFMVTFIVSVDTLGFLQWSILFSIPAVKVASFFTLLALIAHAWVGIWTVTTDYLKHTGFRLMSQVIVMVLLVYYGFWGCQILWGV